jgi:uncharacterized protein (DUF433 family)
MTTMNNTAILDTIHIVSTEGMLGGRPRIDGRRISVQQIAEHRIHAGWTPEEIAEALNLSLAEVYAALSYYYDHREEIDQSIQQKNEWAEQIKKEQRDFAGQNDVLSAVMSAKAVAVEFGISDRTVRDAIEHGWIEAVKSAGTWLIRRKDAEARWGKK